MFNQKFQNEIFWDFFGFPNHFQLLVLVWKLLLKTFWEMQKYDV